MIDTKEAVPNETRVAEILRVFNQTKSQRATARKTGATYWQVRKACGAKESPIVGLSPESEPDPIQAEQERLERTRRLQNEREALKAIAGEHSLRESLERLLRDVVPRVEPPPPYTAPRALRGCSTETMLLVLSDWHGYEIVNPERVLGLNEYNADVLARRARSVISSTLSIKERMENGGGWRFPKAVVTCNGDFVSGTIHELERHTDAPNLGLAVYGVANMLTEALRDLAANFERVDVVCTSGNHGRFPDAKKMQQKDPTRNWDTIIYLMAKIACESLEHVRFIIPDSYATAYAIGPWKFLQVHGHEVKSWMNLPYYGLDRYSRNINALLTSNDQPINYFIISHFHSGSSLQAPGGEMFVSGSLIGGTEYTINTLGKCDPPMQLLLCVHPEHGVTSRWPILANSGNPKSYTARPWLQCG